MMASALTGRTRPTPIRATARWLLGRVFSRMWWFLGILAVFVLLAYPLLRFVVTDVVSLWELTGDNAPKWFLFAVGIGLVTEYLPPLVAAGITRARVASAAALALLGAAVVLALVAPLGFLVESVYGRAFGWDPVLQFGHLFTSTKQPLLVFVEYLLSGTLFAYSGLLVGFTFYRSGWLLGIVLLPFTVGVPWVIADLLIKQGSSTLLRLPGLEPAAGAGLLLLLVIAMFALVRLLLPSTPLRTKTQ